MQRYEYKVIAAPRKGEKARGLKSTEDRFAHALTNAMNDMAREGWEYWRTDTLPVEERSGLTGKTTTFQNMMIFRKELASVAKSAPQVEAAVPVISAPVVAAPVTPPSPKITTDASEGAAPALGSALKAEPEQ